MIEKDTEGNRELGEESGQGNGSVASLNQRSRKLCGGARDHRVRCNSSSSKPSREGLKKAFTDFVGVKAVGILGSVVLVAGQGGRDWKGVRSEWE